MRGKEASEVVFACGNANILASHKTTLEITRETHLSKRATCIIAVTADKALGDLDRRFRETLQSENAEITILIEAGEIRDVVNARGSPRLLFKHPTDIVVRKSNYVCSRTLAICADKASADISRRLVDRLKDPKQKVKITFIARV